ncbi:hypothetical protein KUTeg_003434 [Tegillarca granosa]|uniref:Uncharacterized protein n=1 Tax=Tegillarca granosa TaxID=220873 RepID=A0ABQ9FRN6_TEGGR|nr:hypothetical protein KUTeg_003434 [Tegillarca granosa]
MDKNKLGSIMKVMCEKCGITGRKVNHFAPKTTVTTLVHNRVPPTKVMQITGHMNINSINNYSSASVEQQKRMSNILSDISLKPNNDNCQYELQNVSLLQDIDDDNLIEAFQQIEKGENVECIDIAVPLPTVSDNFPSFMDLPFNIQHSNSSSLSSSHSLFTGASNHGGSFTINISNCCDRPAKKRKVETYDKKFIIWPF